MGDIQVWQNAAIAPSLRRYARLAWWKHIEQDLSSDSISTGQAIEKKKKLSHGSVCPACDARSTISFKM